MGATVIDVKRKKNQVESVEVGSLSKRKTVISILIIGLLF